MTNREWLMNKMQNMRTEELCNLLQDFNLKEYGVEYDTSYGKCMCEWLDAEHKEKPKLSEVERVILENIDKDYKWIARDKEECLRCYDCKPVKGNVFWNITGKKYAHMGGFNHLFQFIKWEDTEPYNIEELLKWG